ncbi:hypothetical protein ABZ519_41525 [Streptomyces collinus]|uniref:hypothetical protein n=1 Tax=Streptomyces TaxID=1883 RepID=UPI0033F1739F
MEPSRDTPHAMRNSSRGTYFLYVASTIASDAAPHSAASICIKVGERAAWLKRRRW